MTSAHYILHRVNLDIEAPDEQTARRVQNQAAHMLYHWIIPKLEERLEGLVPKDLTLRLDRLDLVLDPIDPTGFSEVFGEALLNRFTETIQQVVSAASSEPGAESPAPFSVLTPDERIFAAFLSFLETGRLPWWSERAADPFAEATLLPLLERVIRSNPDAAARLTALLRSQASTLERLLLQFPPDVVLHLHRLLLSCTLLQSDEESVRLADIILHRLASGPAEDPPAPQKRLEQLRSLPGWLDDAPVVSQPAARGQSRKLVEYSGQLPAGEAPPSSIRPQHRLETDWKNPAQTAELGKDGMYLDNAGLVLLHPFLEYFFLEFNLLDARQFQDDDARNLAVHLLHFLATGRENPPEFLLTFEKFLCGAELLAPIPRGFVLTDAMKAESDTLLRAAIGHWSALKSTSPEGLREGFLQRPGKLIFDNFDNRLIVEAKAHDMLLNYLPWGCGIIKLPWLDQPIIVDWVG